MALEINVLEEPPEALSAIVGGLNGLSLKSKKPIFKEEPIFKTREK